MTEFHSAWAAAVADLYREMGAAATYRSSPSADPVEGVLVLSHREIVGQDGHPQVVDGKCSISILRTSVERPARGAIVTILATDDFPETAWRLVSPILADQHQSRWIAERV